MTYSPMWRTAKGGRMAIRPYEWCHLDCNRELAVILSDSEGSVVVFDGARVKNRFFASLRMTKLAAGT